MINDNIAVAPCAGKRVAFISIFIAQPKTHETDNNVIGLYVHREIPDADTVVVQSGFQVLADSELYR